VAVLQLSEKATENSARKTVATTNIFLVFLCLIHSTVGSELVEYAFGIQNIDHMLSILVHCSNF
jgi:hypothetical protein